MTSKSRFLALALLMAAAPAAFAGPAFAQAPIPLLSTPQTVLRGEINNSRAPVLRICTSSEVLRQSWHRFSGELSSSGVDI